MDNVLRVVKPFSTLQELYDRLENLEAWPVDVETLRETAEYVYTTNSPRELGKTKLNRDEQPRTILCHDMKGGYLEDRFIDGSLANDSYLFYHWSVIDVFIYFSHHMVTIPPLGWISAAHKHGVKVLGTLITEGDAGEQVWTEILASDNETTRFARALVTLARVYKFEGWLLNVENKIQPGHVERLQYFVQFLTEQLHEEIPDAEVIWYDSVTSNGDLNWQNCLNEKNKCFFDKCDGIFLNYNWSDIELEKSRAIASGEGRIRDVYVGLDVWGRGCPGGGGFNSLEALTKIRQYNLSAAIFAPGWTHEYFDGKQFQEIENIFWAQLSPLLYIHVSIYDNEDFLTSFCRGAGRGTYLNGISHDEGTPFYNLSLQQPQVSVPAVHLLFTRQNVLEDKTNCEKRTKTCRYETNFNAITVHGNKIDFEEKSSPPGSNYLDFTCDTSYNGGGCLKVIVNHPSESQRLFLIHLEFNSDVEVVVVHRPEARNVPMTSGDCNSLDPKVFLSNEISSACLEPVKSIELANNWRQSHYTSSIKTILEMVIGLSRVDLNTLNDSDTVLLKNDNDENSWYKALEANKSYLQTGIKTL